MKLVIISHAAGPMTYGLYAGDIGWERAGEAMVKVSYG